MKSKREGKTKPKESAQESNPWQQRQVKPVTNGSPEAAVAQAAGADAHASASRLLCEEISRISGGVCFLGFSRGKDSIAAWLQLRKYFTRIIPFHCASVPNLKFVDESLDYYERVFNTPILRYMDGDCVKSLEVLWWQPPNSEADIDTIELWRFDKHDIIKHLQKKYNLPLAWCAFGINMTDSIDRRIWVEKIGGRNDNHKTFYPCFDWKKKQIVDSIMDAGIKLPKDYLFANRSMAAIPAYRHLYRMKEWAPEDYERIKLMFPMIEAGLARQEFRQEKFQGKAKAKVCPLPEQECTA